MSCAPCQPCTPLQFCTPEDFGLLFPSLVGQMGPPGGPGTYVDSYASLRALDATIWPNGYQAYVAGYATVHDGGDGVFTYVAAATDADNDGTIIAPSNGIGRWFRVYTGPLDVRWFGATGGGVADDTAALQAAFDVVATGDGQTAPRGVSIYAPAGIYLFSSLTMQRGTVLLGDGVGQTIFRRTDTTGYAMLFDSTGLTAGGVGDKLMFRDFSLIQVGVASNGGGIYLNGVTDTVQGVFENIRVEAAYRGILTTNSLNTYMKNVQCISCVGDGFYAVGGAVNQTLIGCFAEDAGSSGFSLTSGQSCNYIGCKSDDNVDNGFYALNSNSCAWIGCGNEGNVVGIYLTNCNGSLIDNFFTYVKVTADNAVLLDNSDNCEVRNISSNHQNAAYGTYMVLIANASANCTLSVGYTSNNWPSGLTNVAASFDMTRHLGVVTYTAEMVFSNPLITVNLPGVAGTTGTLWENAGVVEVAP